jgi:hypothetical protein
VTNSQTSSSVTYPPGGGQAAPVVNAPAKPVKKGKNK